MHTVNYYNIVDHFNAFQIETRPGMYANFCHHPQNYIRVMRAAYAPLLDRRVQCYGLRWLMVEFKFEATNDTSPDNNNYLNGAQRAYAKILQHCQTLH